MKNFKDIDQLSSYLDGRLSPSESTRLESRLTSDPELASTFNDIRAARSILRKLPARKAPRNFTLTRQMVGLKPPLPRSYSFFQFSTAFATLLLVLTFAANALTQLPRITLGAGAPAPAAAQEAYGLGSGAAATEAPAAATEAPAATQVPMAAAAPLNIEPTKQSLPPSGAADTNIVPEVPVAKVAGTAPASQDQPQVKKGALVPVVWQIALLILGLVSGVTMLALHRSAKQKWK